MKDLRIRRDQLQQECARQRDALAAHIAALQPAERIASPLWRLTRFVRDRPGLTALLSLAVLRLVRRHRWARYLSSATLGLRLLSVLRALFPRR